MSVEETHKGWVRDPISSGGRVERCSPLKGSMERSTGISWGSHCSILCCCPMAKQPGALQSAAVSLSCLLREDFQPWTAIMICILSFLFVCLTLPCSMWSLICNKFKLLFQTCNCVTSIAAFQPSQVAPLAWKWPSAVRIAIQMRAQGGFLRCRVYISSLVAPWIQCQARTSS